MASRVGRSEEDDDSVSEAGGLFERGVSEPLGRAAAGASTAGPPRVAPGVGVVRSAPVTAAGWGRGPATVDRRKFRYDVDRARARPALSFSVTKADRMTATEAGDMLHQVHTNLGIDKEAEERIAAFDNALWFEHTVNGASMLQPGRGELIVDGVSFDVSTVKALLGENQRRFFRAFADEIAAANRLILDSYDPYSPESVEMVGQLRQVAVERGLQKFPHLAHDSSDA